MPRLGHNPALDGVRGVAILLVLARHAFPATFSGAGYGVDVFFVLSGFLIATLLLEELDATDGISLRGFYERRARRLLPALVLMLAAFVAIEIAKGRTDEGVRAAAFGITYTMNVAEAWWPGLVGYRLPTGVLWSLAQEEQFYLLAPLVLLLLWRRRIGTTAVMLLLAAVYVAVSAEVFLVSMRDGWWSVRVHVGPDTHCGGLVLGVLLAFGLRRIPRNPQRALRFSRHLGTVAVLFGVPMMILAVQFAWESPLINLVGVCLVCVAVCQAESGLGQLLARRPLRFMGRISYSLYLWHWLVLWLLAYQHRGVALAAAVAVAYASTRFVEEPLRRRRQPMLVAQPVAAAG